MRTFSAIAAIAVLVLAGWVMFCRSHSPSLRDPESRPHLSAESKYELESEPNSPTTSKAIESLPFSAPKTQTSSENLPAPESQLLSDEASIPNPSQASRVYEGVVVDQTGVRCANAKVSLYGAGSFSGSFGLSAPKPIATTQTDSSGQFTLSCSGLPKAQRSLQCSKNGYLKSNYSSVDHSCKGLKLVLRRGAQLSARIRLPGGDGLAGCIDSLQFTFLDSNYQAIYVGDPEQNSVLEGSLLAVTWRRVPPQAVALVVCHRALGAVFKAHELVGCKGGAKIRPQASYLRSRMGLSPRLWIDVEPDLMAPGVAAEQLQLARTDAEPIPVLNFDLRDSFRVVSVDTRLPSGRPTRNARARIFGAFGSLAMTPEPGTQHRFVALIPKLSAQLEVVSPHCDPQVMPIHRNHEHVVLH